MAYQTRGRDPLFDSNTQAALERRGKELIGLALLGLGAACAALLATYLPDDPSWMSATSEPARNALGKIGASIAAPLLMIVGVGSWGFAATFLIWGGRFVLHQGSARAPGRAIFAPIAIALTAIYAATHPPGPEWQESFGLGGLFGDTGLGLILGLLGVSGAVGLKTVAFFLMWATLAMWMFVLGFSRVELRCISSWLIRGTIMGYAGVMSILGVAGRGVGGGMRASAQAGVAMAAKAREAHVSRRSTEPDLPDEPPLRGRPVLRAARGTVDDPDQVWDDDDDDAARPSLRDRLPAFFGRAKPQFHEDEVGHIDTLPEGPDRIKAKIADVIRQRVGAGPASAAPRAEPQITGRHPRGPQPMILAQTPTSADLLEADDDISDRMPEPELVDPQPISAPDAPAFSTVRPFKPVVQHTARKALQPSSRAQAEAQPALAFDETADKYELPPLNLLTSPDTVTRHVLSDEALEENARMLENVLDDYGVKGDIVSVRPGPVVTMYELEPAPGLKASRVIGLADDIARSMSALSARVSTVPGRSVIGIELPNENREMCVLREILSSRDFGDGNHRLPLALGKDIGGDPVVANLAKMPHLLIAGTTGSGKSVAINTMILSLLYKLKPEECRMIMIDPKMLELSVYDGIPHLLSPVVTDPKKAVVALKWVVGEMEDRYRKMSKMGVRNIDGFNGRVREALGKGELFERTVQTGFDDDTGEPIFETEEIQPEVLPFIVVIVDEMADLMMVAGKEIEACIQRLAQMARASGIHLIMATQRPSVDVITGTIKANFPTRISFQVTSKIDSRTILGEQGAEQLLGMGDMLYMAGGSKITRVHGPFCSDEEVEEIVTYLKGFGPPEYMSGVVEGPDESVESNIDAVLGLGSGDGEDALYDQAVAIVIKDRKCSTSYIQRKLAIGYNKAARLVEQMEDEGVVSSANHVGKREILVPEQQ